MTKDISQVLRESDPVAREDGMAQDEVRRMRQAVINASPMQAAPSVTSTFWPRPIFVTLTVAATLVVAVLVGHRLPAPPIVSGDGAAVQNRVPEEGERRQLQFQTPGGTRIIWTFDSNFSL